MSLEKLSSVYDTLNTRHPSFSGNLLNDFPEMRNIEFDPFSLFHFSEYVRENESGVNDFYQSQFLSELLQYSIMQGNSEFVIVPPENNRSFPYCVRSSDNRVKLILMGDLGRQGCKGAENLDILVQGSVDDQFLIFGKNSRAYVEKNTGKMPLFRSKDCVLDAYEMGANPLYVENGRIHLRGSPPRKIWDATNLQEFYDEATPLLGPTPKVFTYLTTWLEVEMGIRRSGIELTSSVKGSRHFRKQPYPTPDWVPQISERASL